MSQPEVLLNRALPDYIEEQLAPYCTFRPWSLLSEGDDAARAAIRGIVTYGHTHIDDTVLDRLPNAKVISSFGVGYDHIDVPSCTRHGVAVGNTPGAVDGATADMTWALLLGFARNIVVGDHFARGPEFTRFDPSRLIGKEVYGSTLGIVGLGRIGQQVARRAAGFDMTVLYHNRSRNPAAEKELGVRYATLEELLETADFVTLNVPLSDATRHLIGTPELRRMKSDAVLINIARGGVVDTDALHQALSEHWIAGAALDVTEPEPLPRNHPLLGMDNLVITPHLGSATLKTRRWMGKMMMENLRAGLAGERLPYQVNG